MKIMNDRNYKKYAIRNPRNFREIHIIDEWTKKTTMAKLNIYV